MMKKGFYRNILGLILCFTIVSQNFPLPVTAKVRNVTLKKAEKETTEDGTEQEISLTWKEKKTSLKIGEKITFRVKITGTEEKVTWSVSDKKLASISKKGVLKAKSKGKVTVKASVDDVQLKTKVTIYGKKKVAIDAGHQAKANLSLEPIGPGAKTKKMKVSGGCVGVATHVPEYKFTLRVAKKLKKELESRGYDVYMVRTKHNVNISNKERALKTNKSGSDIYIRIHGDSNGSGKLTGASGLYPSKSNPYVGSLSAKSYQLTKKVMAAYCKKTGIRNRGCVERNDLTGTNWSKIPVTLIECGFMSNSAEDKKLQNSSFQYKIAAGLADGIDDYFGY